MTSRTWFHIMRGAGRQMWRNRLRSLLVVACAALGVAGAITAVNYASGGRAQVLEQISRLGANLVMVSAEQSRAVADRDRTGTIVATLKDADYRAIREEVTGPVRSSGLVTANLRLKAGYLSKTAPVVGVEPDYFPMKAWQLRSGGFFDLDHVGKSARVALLGDTVARELFEANSPLGERLFINRVPFEVIGVLHERGPGLDAANEDGRVFVPLTAAMRRLLNIDHYNAIVFEIPEHQRMGAVERDIATLLRTRHRISPFRPDDFKVQTQRELINTQLQAAERLRFLVRWIGFSALLVGGLGILAIAWIAVRHRIPEIGTRRALGATAGHVFFQFAFEAAVLAALGIGLGFLLGWAASWLTAARIDLPFVFDRTNAVLAMAIALVINLLFASWPAIRAARLDPIWALRHE